jgi:hypothetical protein
MCTDDKGLLPLHLACKNGANIDDKDKLVNSFPWSECIQDYDGGLPVHLADEYGASEIIVGNLIGYYLHSLNIPISATTSEPKVTK